jgi:hypothetical protein
MGRQESFTILDQDGSASDLVREPRDGVYVSKAAIFAYVLFSVALATAVGCIVHFAAPCSSTCDDVVATVAPTLHPDAEWERCVNMSWERNECE